MKIVIDIPDVQYEYLAKIAIAGEEPLGYFERVIMRGTPLPKGHGRLIDENELKKEATRCEWSRNMYGILDHTLSYMKPIIEADKESENK